MDVPRSPVAFAVLLLAASVMAGATSAGIGRVLAEPVLAPPTRSGAEIDAAQIGEVCRRLDRLIEAVSERPSLPPPEAPDRQALPVAPNDDRSDLALLQEIRDLLARSSLPSTLVAPPSGSNSKGEHPELWAKLEDLEFEQRDVTRMHFCWTPRDVLSHYGQPDSTSYQQQSGLTSWRYVLGPKQWLQFNFREGLLDSTQLSR